MASTFTNSARARASAGVRQRLLTRMRRLCSKYPTSRTRKDADGALHGVAGSVELLNARIIGSQPIVAFDWSPDKEGLACMACLDQTIRVYIVTKLHKY